ncbi:MAG: heme exporter protein CcmB [Comamonadaceae bacterium]|nr:MAG: heme exporter protein CcmB [Comamonadaceae bacterium]
MSLPLGLPAVLPAPARGGGLLEGIGCVAARDLRVALRRRADTLCVLVFFVMVASLFPLGVGTDVQLLRSMAPGVVWVAALLASMLSMGRLFADDWQDGTLEQMLLSAHPLPLLVLGKVAAHWAGSGLLLTLVSPLLALQYGLPASACGVLFIALLLGTPVLSLIGAIGAALTVGLRGGGVLLSLLVLPLCVPVLIFGAGAVESHLAGMGVAGHFSLLGALLAPALAGAPVVAAAALRIALE